jgi:hypothetical protein
MSKQFVLRPSDVGVVLGLVESPDASFQQLHEMLGISGSNAFDAVQRLRDAGLIRQDERAVVRSALLEFLVHGARYAFPASLGAPAKGVPTAHAGPPLASKIRSNEPIVWPSPAGHAIGMTLTPLFPQATALPQRCPPVYASLTLVDALRVGRTRERKLAADLLRAYIYDESQALKPAGSA